jgi:hypothetical protein
MASDEHQRMREEQPSADPRVHLWLAVIHQALVDATTPLAPSATKLTSERLNQKRAREWFTKPNRYFYLYCDLADLEADRVRAHAIPLIEAAAKLDPPMPEPTAPGRPRNPDYGRLYTFNGRSLTLAGWSAQTGISYGALYRRIVKRGWSIERALSTKARNTNPNRKRNPDANINQAESIAP